MDLKNLIRPQLWNEISNSYIAENYKTAILDAMRHLSKVIRDKSGLDGDGVPLVSQAFGGDDPKLRINKLQTQSEKDEQRGFQQIVSGLYSAIRNPRTHEDIQDNINVSDPVIYFINYILTILDVARPPFTIEDFIPRVYDIDFVERKDYAEELIKEIPQNKRLETLIEIYRQKSNGEGKKLAFVCKEVVEKLTNSEVDEYIQIVSEELDMVGDEKTIIKILQILPAPLWPKVKKTARMRIENKLIASIKKGVAIINRDSIRDGSFGTWATKIIEYFTLKDDLKFAFTTKLYSNDPERALYIFKFFLDYLPLFYKDAISIRSVVDSMHRVVSRGDIGMRARISEFSGDVPEDWLSLIKEIFSDFTDSNNPEYYFRDGSPFLGKVPPYVPPPEDDIPF